MPISVSQGCMEIHSSKIRQLATRPESTPLVAVKKNSAVLESRIQYISANVGKTFQERKAAIATKTPATGATRAKGMRRRLTHTSTNAATSRFTSDPRE